MKKIFLTFVLAIVSSLWMMSEGASCLTQAPNNLQSSYITVSGTIQWLDNPCEEGEVCPACITPAIVTSDKTYYLSSSNQEVQDFLDRIEMAPVPAIYQLPLQASATGIPYTQGSFDFLVVNNLNSLYVQYFSDQRGSINSLCDEWNVLISNMSMGPMFESFNTIHYRLTTDTIINGTRYVRLERGGGYKGAMREGNNRDIYYIPANSTHEYLIYAFNAQVGATLTNMWVGGSHADTYNGKRAIVREIQDTNPRTFVVGYEFTYNNGNDTEWWDYTWIEGVGMTSGPNGNPCPFDCNGAAGESVLCAYKKGEQVYTSEIGEKYGCEYNYNPSSTLTDTIPLYARDDSGSSTVDPVDPNQIYATLTGDVLTVHNRTGVQVTFTLNNTSVNNVVARVRKNGQPTTFTESISVELTEDGIYEIWLTSEEWNYTIFGTFNHVRSSTNTTKQDPALTTKKIFRGTQILIERGNKTYTLTGQEVK